MSALLTALDLCKTYGEGETAVQALDHVNFSIEKGTLTIVLGPSGAGKSTLLNLLGGMDRPTSGILAVDGENIAAYNRKQRTIYRREKIGFVFQFYNLMQTLTAEENLKLATELCADRALDNIETLTKVGLGERTQNYPAQLSGGEQQRVSIARALAKSPEIILCDEPTGALDYQTGKDVLSLLYKAAKEEGKTVIIVTHNTALKEMGDHLIQIKNGQVVSDETNPNPKRIEDIEW